MSDLISRSALLESLMHCDALGRKSFEAVMEIIKEQPTAYDIDGVVEQLEREKETYKRLYGLHREGCYLGISKGLDMTIKIVKAGGIYEHD